MSNGFANYFPNKWMVVKQLTNHIARVQDKNKKVGYYVIDGHIQSVIVFGDEKCTWLVFEASKIAEDTIMAGKNGLTRQYTVHSEVYQSLVTALVNEAISEE